MLPCPLISQPVDDLLARLDRTSAPFWASTLVILFLILGVPMAWHKAMLDSEVGILDRGCPSQQVGQDLVATGHGHEAQKGQIE